MSRDYLRDFRDVANLLSSKKTQHRSYKHYSTLERVKSILSTEVLYLSDGSSWNDRTDADNFNREFDPYKRFGFSFSWLPDENVAMWMLYGGITSHGAMIDFPSSFLQGVITGFSTVELGHFDGRGNFVSCGRFDLNDGARVDLVDVAYWSYARGNRNEIVELRVRNQSIVSVYSDALFSDDRSMYCVKAFPWMYETESRLVVSVPRERISPGCTIARMRIPGVSSVCSGSAYHSPTYKGAKIFNPSALTGQVDWDLCAGCKKRSRRSREVGV